MFAPLILVRECHPGHDGRAPLKDERPDLDGWALTRRAGGDERLLRPMGECGKRTKRDGSGATDHMPSQQQRGPSQCEDGGADQPRVHGRT
jgi:hypothetical protein